MHGWDDDTPDIGSGLGEVDQLDAARQVRDRLLASERWLESEEVAIQARHSVVDVTSLRRQHCLFGVRWRDEYLYPAFQFLPTGEVHPMMAELLSVLPTTDANWNAAFWLFQPNGKLGARRPADVFASDPVAVMVAAREDFVTCLREGKVLPERSKL